MIEALTAKVPLARLIRDPRGGTPLLAWVEAANVLPPAGVPWASEQSHFLATLPVNAVSTGVRLLLAEFSEQVRSAEGERFPMLDLAVAADPSSRSNIPAAPKAKG
jgi:hypothetical protein